MQVKLRVMRGAHAGREIAVSVPEFLIGRGEECHLRPRSEAVSRRHCQIKIEPNQVTITDLNSKNGTLINGQPIEGTLVLKAGDRLQVGPLEFELVIDHVLGGVKRPVVKDVKEAAARTVSASTTSANTDDLDITKWLEEDADTDVSRAVAGPETRLFHLEETSNLALDTQIGKDGAEGDRKLEEETTKSEADDAKSSRWKKLKKDHKHPGKLPKRPQITAKDSRDAAAEMLKKFFNRR